MPFTPTDLSGLKLWLDASTLGLADNADVLLWPDLSGNGRDLSCRAGVDNPPAFKTNIANGKPVIRFVAVNSEFLFSQAGATGPVCHIFVVARFNGATFPDYNGLIGGISELLLLGEGGSSRFYAPITGNPKWYLDGTDTSATTRAAPMGVLGIAEQDFLSPYYASVSIILGAERYNAGRYWDGDMAEIMIYDHSLVTADRQLAEGYLAWKWGTQALLPAGHPWKSVDPNAPVLTPISTSDSAVAVDSATIINVVEVFQAGSMVAGYKRTGSAHAGVKLIPLRAGIRPRSSAHAGVRHG